MALVFWEVFGSGLPRWGRPLGVAIGLIAVVSIGMDAARYGLLWAAGRFLFQGVPAIVGATLLTGWVMTHFFPDALLSSGSEEDRLRAVMTTVMVATGSAVVAMGLFSPYA